MNQVGIVALIRGGDCRLFQKSWTGVFLFRDLVWGPSDFEAWVLTLEEATEWNESAVGGAVADYDRRRLTWCDTAEILATARVHDVYQRLLQAAWPGFEIVYAARSFHDLMSAAGLDASELYDPDHRLETLEEADLGEYFDDDDEDQDDETEDDETANDEDADDETANDEDADDEDDDDEDDGYYEDDDYEDEDLEEARAWVTVIDPDGAVHHRQLSSLPKQLLFGDKGVIEDLLLYPATGVPAERWLSEGMWFDFPRRTIGVWGRDHDPAEQARMEVHWQGWKVQGAESYARQCSVSGPPGTPMSDSEALAEIVPVLLGKERGSLEAMESLAAFVGQQVKSLATLGAGCLLMLIGVLLLLVGLFTGAWKPVLISLSVTFLVILGGFKITEFVVRRRFRQSLLHAREASQVAVAGPQEPVDRQQQLEELCRRAGLKREASSVAGKPPRP